MDAAANTPGCADHPSRATTEPCARCGRFVCDWCVKTSPNWARGQCVTCQRFTEASRRSEMEVTNGMKGVIVLLIVQGIGLTFEFGREWQVVMSDPTYPEWLVVIGVLGLITAAAALLIGLGRKLGIRLAQGSLSFVVLLNLLNLPFTEFDARAVIVTLVRLLLYFIALRYLFFSREVRDAIATDRRKLEST